MIVLAVVLSVVSVVVSGCVKLILVVLLSVVLVVGMRGSRVVVGEVGCALRHDLSWCQAMCITATPVGLTRTRGAQKAE